MLVSVILRPPEKNSQIAQGVSQFKRRWLDPPGTHPNHRTSRGSWRPIVLFLLLQTGIGFLVQAPRLGSLPKKEDLDQSANAEREVCFCFRMACTVASIQAPKSMNTCINLATVFFPIP